MTKLVLIFSIAVSLGCSDQKASKPSEDALISLDQWADGIYREVPTRKENLRCETDNFLFSIGTDQGWIALFFNDKRTLKNASVSSSAYFMSDGKKLVQTTGDAGDGRFPGVKFMKTLQSFDAVLFVYQIGGQPPEHIIFPHINGEWLKPNNESEQVGPDQPPTRPEFK
jgi:hypothetical protein